MGKKGVVWLCMLLVLIGSAVALGNGKIGYVEYLLPPGEGATSFPGLTHEPVFSEEFEGVPGPVSLSSPSQTSDGVNDYYKVWLYQEQPVRKTLRMACCRCGIEFNDERMNFGSDAEGTFVTLYMNEGWNKLEVEQVMAPPVWLQRQSGKHAGRWILLDPGCDLELTLPNGIAPGMDGVSSFPFKCDPSNDCCEPDGSDFKPVDSVCGEDLGGQCDGEGRCSDPDDNQEECEEKFGLDAYLEFGENHCCGDDKSDCFSYNNGFFCISGGGWNAVQPNIGSVFQSGCLGPANAAIGSNGAHICYMTPPPLDYEFTYTVQVPTGDNSWRFFSNGGLVPGLVPDETFLRTPYGPGTTTEVATNVYSPNDQDIKVEVNCDPGVRKAVDIDGVVQEIAPSPEKSEFVIKFKEGINKLSVLCQNDGVGGSERHIQIYPKLSDLGLTLSARVPEQGMLIGQDLTVVLQKDDESIGDIRDLIPLPDTGDTMSQDEIDALLAAGVTPPAPDEESVEEIPPPQFVIIRSEDPDIIFNHTDAGTEENPLVVKPTGQVRVKYVGPQIPPPFKELGRAVIQGHGYACVKPTGEDTKMIVECAGETTAENPPPYSSVNAMQVSIGDSFVMSNRQSSLFTKPEDYKQNWCSGKGPWVDALDGRDNGYLTCQEAKNLQGTPLNLEFTGNYCCGDEGPGEFYGDFWNGSTGMHGGCLDSNKVDFGEFPMEDNPESATEGHLTNNLGVFQLCAPDISPLPGVGGVEGQQ